jgi:Protein of unknown function (DUF3102)
VKLAVGTGRKAHAARINEAWSKGVEAIVETGMRIIDAREALEHGEYIAMVTEDLHCSRATAFKLVAIASNKTLTNVSHAKHLPAKSETLYQLTVVANKGFDLEAAVESGAIHPRMERKDVKALLPSPRQKKKRRRGKPLVLPDPADTEHERDLEFLRSAWASASPEARHGFVHACWDEIMRARAQVGSGGNGADHEEAAASADPGRWSEK